MQVPVIPQWDASLEIRICSILEIIKYLNLDLASFLDSILYGDEHCTANVQIKQHRTVLLNSPVFGNIVSRCYKRPRKANGDLRVTSQAMRNFAITTTKEACNEELNALGDVFQSDTTISEASLLATNFRKLKDICATQSPVLYDTLTAVCTTSKQHKWNKKKFVADKVIVLIISIILYQRSSNVNVVQKFLSIYWVACGIPSHAFQLLHTLGLAMSPTWTQEAIETLTNDALSRVHDWMSNNPFAIIHDNVNIAFKVSSQQVDHRNHFDNGTAFTILPLPPTLGPVFMNPHRRMELDQWQHASERKQLSWDQIFDAVQSSESKLREYCIFHVIQFLLQHPTFVEWSENMMNSALIGFPGDMDLLPCGPNHCTKNWPLCTMKIDESTLEGTVSVVEEVWKQTGFKNREGEKSLATEHLVPWIGDQKSVALLHGIRGFRARDLNGFDRMDYVIPLKGWFHEVMALQNQIHHKHLGNNNSTGLACDITYLRCIGLKPQSKNSKVDFHDLHELIRSVLQARILDCWLAHTGCSTLTDLADKKLSEFEIKRLGAEIVDMFTSSHAIHQMRSELADTRDDVWLDNALFLRDALVYWEVTRVIKIGDVGRLSNTTPTLLLMFVGGGNNNYATELLEELQLEWNLLTPLEVDSLHHHCWLANTSGRREGFFPMDQLQEHNIRDIKHIYAPQGPNGSWEFLGKISPAIPTLRKVSYHVENHFRIGSRGRKHSDVSRWQDVDTLLAKYREGDPMHRKICGHNKLMEKAPDVMRAGIIDLCEGQTLVNWQANRSKFIHSTGQVFKRYEGLASVPPSEKSPESLVGSDLESVEGCSDGSGQSESGTYDMEEYMSENGSRMFTDD